MQDPTMPLVRQGMKLACMDIYGCFVLGGVVKFIDLGSCIEAAIICVPSVEDYLHSIEYRVLGMLLQNNPIYRYTLQFGTKVLLLNGERVWAEYDGFDIDIA